METRGGKQNPTSPRERRPKHPLSIYQETITEAKGTKVTIDNSLS